MQYLLWILQIILVPVAAPLGVGIIDKIKARLQCRRGASILQPYRNLYKLFHKDEVISKDASWIFRAAPFIIFTTTLIVGASIPLISSMLHAPTSDLLMIVYLLGIGTFFLALAGIDTGSAFGGFGSSREMTLSALAEGSFVLSILVSATIMGTTNLTTIAAGITGYYNQFPVSILLAFAGFYIVLLAENKRFPFDNPATHLELTMVHEAMLLEYSGKRLALMEWSSACKLFIFSALAANMFFPIGLASTASWQAVALAIGALFLKVFVIFISIALLESLMAKFRFFRLPDMLFAAFILNAIAIGLAL
jgi:formate hydrogenlyase subunit 4